MHVLLIKTSYTAFCGELNLLTRARNGSIKFATIIMYG